MSMPNLRTLLFVRARSFSHIDPARDWLVLLIVSIMALAGIIVWNAFAFDIIASGGVIGVPSKSTELVLSQSSLDAIHAVFADRATEEAKYLDDVYRYTDPSQ